MKVYYNKPDEYRADKEFNNVEEYINILLLQKFKYKIMWHLRFLETQINEEGGIIIVSIKSIETKGFSQELTDKIREVFKASVDTED